MRALRRVVESGQAAGKPVTLCGELAGRPLEALALAAIGFRSLSMASAAVGPVKAMIRAVDIGPVSDRVNILVDQGAPGAELRDELRAWAEAHSVPI